MQNQQDNKLSFPSSLTSKWVIEIIKMVAPAILAVFVFCIQFDRVKVKLEGVCDWRNEVTVRMSQLHDASQDQQRKYDVLNAQILAQLEGLRRDVSELKASRKAN